VWMLMGGSLSLVSGWALCPDGGSGQLARASIGEGLNR
jgi:hypothetical protein